MPWLVPATVGERIEISKGMLLGGEHFRILPGSSGVPPPEHRSVTRLRRRLP